MYLAEWSAERGGKAEIMDAYLAWLYEEPPALVNWKTTVDRAAIQAHYDITREMRDVLCDALIDDDSIVQAVIEDIIAHEPKPFRRGYEEWVRETWERNKPSRAEIESERKAERADEAEESFPFDADYEGRKG
jgi:hypothetical protein